MKSKKNNKDIKRIVCFGTFDLFHIGHLKLFKRAIKFGDELIIGLSTDELNIKKKNRKPIISFEERKELLLGLKLVSKVFPEHKLEDKRKYIKENKIDILVHGDDWKGKFDNLKDIIKIIYLPRTKFISTSEIIKNIKEL